MTGRPYDWLYKFAPIAILSQFEHCALYEQHLETGQPMRWHPLSDMNAIDKAEVSQTVRDAARYRPQTSEDDLLD